MNKYQEALDTLTNWFHSYVDNKEREVHEIYITPKYETAEETIRELINKHIKIKEDLLFLKEQGVKILELPNGRKFLALEITNMPSEKEYRKELFEKLINDIIKGEKQC